jgi:hypothetical protein
MKKLSILAIAVLLCSLLQAAVSKAVNVSTAGTLHNSFSIAEYTSVTDLTVTGTIDARDFKFMRDTLTELTKINIADVNITAYSGTGGTSPFPNADYYENVIPRSAFYSMDPSTKLTNIILPNSITAIETYAFWNCNGLTSMIIPEKVESFTSLFSNCEGMRSIHFKNPIPVIYHTEWGEKLQSRLGLEYQKNNNIQVAIYVPLEGWNAYNDFEEYGGWDPMKNPFISIQLEPTTNLNNQSQQNQKIVLKDGILKASSFTLGASLAIYNLQGTTIYSGKITSISQDISLPARGMYIVRVGNESVKVVY